MKRIRSVDSFRILAILAVIALHTARHAGPDAVGARLDAATLLNQLERFAVPLFFIVSGYFWMQAGAPAHAREHVTFEPLTRALRACARLLRIYVGWVLIYLAWSTLIGRRVHLGLASVFLEGGTVHLWFLPALACALLACGVLLAGGMRRMLVLLAVVMFAIGLSGKAYAQTPLGWHAPFNLRDGPFFSLPFVVTGIELRRLRLPASIWPGLLLAAAGFALQLGEVAWLHARWGASLVQDYVPGTWLFGLGMALLALSDAWLLRLPAALALGPLVLGVYVSHYLFVDLLRPLDEAWHGSAAWGVAYVLLVFGGGLALAWVLGRWRVTRWLVS